MKRLDDELGAIRGDLKNSREQLKAEDAQLIAANKSLEAQAFKQQYISGQMDTLSVIVSKWSSDSSSNQRAIGSAMMQIAKQREPTGVEPTAIQRFTSAQLKEMVFALVKRMRQSVADYLQARRDREEQRWKDVDAADKKDAMPPGKIGPSGVGAGSAKRRLRADTV